MQRDVRAFVSWEDVDESEVGSERTADKGRVVKWER